MKRLACLTSLLLALGSSLCLAQTYPSGERNIPVTTKQPPLRPGEEPVELEFGYSYEALTNGFGNFRQYYLSGQKVFSRSSAIYGTARTANLYGFEDQEVSLGGYAPLASDWTLSLDGSVSPSNRVLPSWSFGGGLYHVFSPGWGVQFGAHHYEYRTGGVNTENLTLDRYWENFRLDYTVTFGQVARGGSPLYHTLQGYWTYDKRNTVGLTLMTGREPLNISGGGIQVLNLNSADLQGTHWVHPDWGLSWGLGLHEVSPLYTGRSAQLGLRHRF